MNMCQPDEAKSGPRKRSKKKKKSNNIFTACFGIICDDDEERRPLKLRKLPPRHEDDDDCIKKWSTRRSEAVKKKRGSCDVESEKAEAQRRYDKTNKLHNLIIPSSSNSNNPNQQQQQTTSSEVVAQNPTWEKYVDQLPNNNTTSSSCLVKKDDHLPFSIRASAAGSLPLDRTRSLADGILITHSSSFHPASLAAPSSSRTKHKIESSSRKTGRAATAKKLDPVLGFSVVLVTMVIMILWGRLFAILCTSAWFYFTSKFKSSTAYPSAGDPPLRLDLESEEHKKKVVLEGFLERKRR